VNLPDRVHSPWDERRNIDCSVGGELQKGDEGIYHCSYFCSAFEVFECCARLLGLELPGFIPEFIEQLCDNLNG
jgi:hypothetical protein